MELWKIDNHDPAEVRTVQDNGFVCNCSFDFCYLQIRTGKPGKEAIRRAKLIVEEHNKAKGQK